MADAAADVGGTRAMVTIYRAYVRNSIVRTLHYRTNMFIELVLMLAEPLVYLMVWRIVAEEAGGSVDGFTPGRFAAYYIVFGGVRTMTQSGSPANWEHWVRNGTMTEYLLRPLHPIHQDVAHWTGFGLMRLVMWSPAGAVLFVAFRPEMHVRPVQVPVFVVALFLASFSATLINDLCGLSAFWFTRVAGISYLVQIGTTLVGGRLVPLELLPRWAETLSFVLPFRWAFGFPIEVLIGPISNRELVIGLAMQLLWLCGIVLLIQVVWRRGVRRFAAVGG